MEEFQPHIDVFRNFHARQIVYKSVSSDVQLLNVYEKLIQTVVIPNLKQQLIKAEEKEKQKKNDKEKKNVNCNESKETALQPNDNVDNVDKDEKDVMNEMEDTNNTDLPDLDHKPSATKNEDDGKHTFYYQYPPTLRLQPGPNKSYGRTHRDAEYGHQIGEVNYWMPISLYRLTKTTLEIENEPNSKEFLPLDIEYGEIGMFHGTLCHHRAPPNLSICTRISFDFRIGISKYYDPEWKLDGVTAQHGRREYTL